MIRTGAKAFLWLLSCSLVAPVNSFTSPLFAIDSSRRLESPPSHQILRQRCRTQLAAGKGFAKAPPTRKPYFYPAMTQAEIAEWMGHIPVYTVTDSEGNGQLLQPTNGDATDKPVFYFFLSPTMAQVYLQQLVADSDSELMVSGLFLGKIWFDRLTSEETNVEYRLVPDSRDLITARSMSAITEDDQKDNKASTSGSSKLTDAMSKSARFNEIYNEVPLFSIDNNAPGATLSRQQAVNQKMLNDLVSSHYMYFSSQNMLTSMEQQQQDESSDTELLSLHELVDLMGKESTTDFRKIVLVPFTPILDGPVSDAVFQEQLQDPMSFIGGTFFHNLF